MPAAYEDGSSVADPPTPPDERPSALTSPPLLSVLRSEKSSKRLNQIDKIRSTGVGAHIALPQIVVCGDQSAGKSSVLEGITGIPFPKKDGLCTRFATEIIVRHDNGPHHVTASLIPSASRSDSERATFAKFKRDLGSFDQLSDVIDEASSNFGVRGYVDDPSAPAFAHDVLRLEVVGDTGLYLTVVDLPGLISVADNEEDVTLVKSLVTSYLQNSRTIILAVIQAGLDIETQGIIQLARQHDKDGERTLGIVTKPDLINEGSESRVAWLSHDRKTLKLGFFLLKNPTPKESQKIKDLMQRERLEERYFSDKRWKNQPLNRSRVGIVKLRKFSQDLLDTHVERELPKVRTEIHEKRRECTDELRQLGTERSSIPDLRAFVSQICQHFNDLAKDASDGKYNGSDIDFFRKEDEGEELLLRARIHALNENFASVMRVHGKKKYIGSIPEAGDEYYPSQQAFTEKEFANWVKTVIRKTRGKELSGNTNHYLLWSLFGEQSERWASIATSHLENIVDLISNFANEALAYAVKDPLVLTSLQALMKAQLDCDAEAAKVELKKILEDEKRQPITYNHYYTDNVQNKRQDALQSAIQGAMSDCVVNRNLSDGTSASCIDKAGLMSKLEAKVVRSMEEYTCAEASDKLDAYYKVAMKTFIDNVCKQVVERHILHGLTKVLDPTEVSRFSDEYLVEVASETDMVKEKRRELGALEQSLEEALKDLK